jgi:hypothetical protein
LEIDINDEGPPRAGGLLFFMNQELNIS